MTRQAIKAATLCVCLLSICLLGQFSSLSFSPRETASDLPNHEAHEISSSRDGHMGILSTNAIMSNGRRLLSLGNSSFIGDYPDDVDCKYYHEISNITNEEICLFVNSTDSCQIDQGFINYMVVIYCQMTSLVPAGVFLFFLWWLFLFIGLATTADDFFCPALEVISKTLKLSHNIAGVTFLAFGNGAPDIFSAIAAIGSAKNDDAGLAIGALFGAGIFVTTVVVGAISVTRPFTAMERPFLRDIIFYLGAVFWTFYVLYDGVMYTGEAVGFICLYIGYVFIVIIGRVIRQRHLMRENFSESVPQQLTIPVSDSEDEDNRPLINAENNPSYGSIQEEELLSPTSSARAITPVPERSIKDLAHIAESVSVSAVLAHDMEQIPEFQPQRSTNEDDQLKMMGSTDSGSPAASRQGLLVEFLWSVCPVDTDGWSDMKIYWKIYELFKAPVLFCLKITIPVVDYNEAKHKWTKLLNCLHLITGPVFCVAAVSYGGYLINGEFPVIVLVLLVGVILSVVVFCTSKQEIQPVYHWAFAYLGFAVSVIWIYSIANEIVNILQMFGVIFSISDGILGLTLLAWGNSIGDLIADTVMARQGFPRMGVSACFGGPLFNLLLGIGIPFTIGCVKRGGTFHLKFTLLQGVLSLFLMLSLLSSLIIVPLRKFYISRAYGFYLWILYLAFITFAVLVETEVLKIPGIDNH